MLSDLFAEDLLMECTVLPYTASIHLLALHCFKPLLILHVTPWLWALLTLCLCAITDWSQLGDFEMTTPLADLLQDISDKGIPTSKDEVSHYSFNLLTRTHCLLCSVAHRWLLLQFDLVIVLTLWLLPLAFTHACSLFEHPATKPLTHLTSCIV